MKTFATLGGVKFELPTIEGLSETMSWEYKEQETVADKAVIQFAGAKARTMEIKAKLMAAFCNPEERIDELKAKAKKIAPLPLILANGTLVGYFVINDLSLTWLKSDFKGNIIAAELTLKLTESEGTADSSANLGAATSGNAGANIKKPISILGLQIPDPLAMIKSTMQQKQQQITGQIPNVNEVLRRTQTP